MGIILLQSPTKFYRIILADHYCPNNFKIDLKQELDLMMKSENQLVSGNTVLNIHKTNHSCSCHCHCFTAFLIPIDENEELVLLQSENQLVSQNTFKNKNISTLLHFGVEYKK